MTPSGLGSILSGISDIGTQHLAYERQRAQDAEEKRRSDLQYQLLQGQQQDRERARSKETDEQAALDALLPSLGLDSNTAAYLRTNPGAVRDLIERKIAPKPPTRTRDYFVGQVVKAVQGGMDPKEAAAQLAQSDPENESLYYAAANDVIRQKAVDDSREGAGNRAQGRFDERIPPTPKAAPKDYVTARARARISAQQYAKQLATGGDKAKLKQAALDAMGLYRNTLPAAELQKIVDEEFISASKGATARPRLTAPI